MNEDGQLRAAHLILDYESISRTFLDIGNSIRANEYRLLRIDVSRPGFLAPHDLPPADHPILQGIPLAAQPLQQVPFGQAVAEEGISSSSSNRNLSISSSSKEEDAAPSSATACPRGTC